MNVRLTQIDGKLPNIALMKLAHWHRSRGDTVFLTRDLEPDLFEEKSDVVYGSTIFTASAKRTERLRRAFPDAIISGTGINPKTGGITVEQTIRSNSWNYENYDYSIYPEFDASIGFTQRGCRLKCKFCGVHTKEGKPISLNNISNVWRGEGHPKKLHLLDNDFFGQPDWRQVIAQIRLGGFKVCMSQGVNTRLINVEGAEALAGIEYRNTDFDKRQLYTAWDNIGDEAIFFRGIDILENAGIPGKHIMAYMLVGFDPKETWDRILHRYQRMRERQIMPYPMVFEDKTYPGDWRTLKHFQRWAIRLARSGNIAWRDYNPHMRAA